jgi:hypothetical protein
MVNKPKVPSQACQEAGALLRGEFRWESRTDPTGRRTGARNNTWIKRGNNQYYYRKERVSPSPFVLQMSLRPASSKCVPIHHGSVQE